MDKTLYDVVLGFPAGKDDVVYASKLSKEQALRISRDLRCKYCSPDHERAFVRKAGDE